MNRVAVRSLLAVAAVALGFGLLWLVFGPPTLWLSQPDMAVLDPKDRSAAITAIHGQVVTVVSAALVAGGLYYNARKVELDRDKQYTDRITNAIGQLGTADVTVRTGGLRALDRILHDSPRDRNLVLRTVTGYLRTHPATDAIPPDDIVAALAVALDRGKPPRGRRDVLNLRGAILKHVDLSACDLRGANLAGSDLSNASLAGADLRETRLDGAVLVSADLTGATLVGAHGAKARFTGAQVCGVDFSGCDLTDARLTDTDLSAASFVGAVLTGTDLGGADLRTSHGLDELQLRRVRRNAATTLPPGLD
jgi:hypothetical protein